MYECLFHSVTGWTGQPKTECLLTKGDTILGVNGLQVSNMEEFNMYISKSLKNKVQSLFTHTHTVRVHAVKLGGKAFLFSGESDHPARTPNTAFSNQFQQWRKSLMWRHLLPRVGEAGKRSRIWKKDVWSVNDEKHFYQSTICNMFIVCLFLTVRKIFVLINRS